MQIFLLFFRNSFFFVYRHSDLQGSCLNGTKTRHVNLVACGPWRVTRSDTGLHDLKHSWKGNVERMTCALDRSGLMVVSLSPCFRDGALGGEVLMEQVQLNFSLPNKFIILLLCGLLVDNNTFSKMCLFKSLTGYTDYGGYVVKKDSAYTHIKINNHIVSNRSVIIHG